MIRAGRNVSADTAAQRVVEAHGGRMVKSTGDGTMAEFDVPSRAVLCALGLRRQLTEFEVEMRAGILIFEPWGNHRLRGVEGDWSVFRIPGDALS